MDAMTAHERRTTAQLAGIAAVEAIIDGTDVNITELLGDLPRDGVIATALMLAARALETLPDHVRRSWLDECRRTVLAAEPNGDTQ